MNTQIAVQQEAKSLLEFIDYYEICNKAEDKSPKTVSWYSANLKSFHNYLKSRHLPDTLDKIDIKVLRQYVLYLLKKNKNRLKKQVLKLCSNSTERGLCLWGGSIWTVVRSIFLSTENSTVQKIFITK